MPTASAGPPPVPATAHPPPELSGEDAATGVARPTGSSMTPFATPSASPTPPSVSVRVTVFPLMTAPGNSWNPPESILKTLAFAGIEAGKVSTTLAVPPGQALRL